MGGRMSAAPVSAADLALAAACLAGDPAAVARLEGELIAPALRALARHGFTPSTLVEAAQVARLRLLFPSEQGAAAALASYTGEGPLGRFVEVVVTHAAAGLSRGVPARDLDTIAESELIERLGVKDVEAMLARAEERAVVRDAVQRAIASLTPRERAILRFHLLDRRTHEDIAQVYGVTRMTVARWLDEARAKLSQRTRSAVAGALGEVGLAEMALSQIDLSLSRLLGGA
jgi:RNA polymerase sigma-70 factor (ECF subfamily)